MSIRLVWRKKLNNCNTSNDVDVNLPTPMPKPQSPLKEPSQENPPTTQSNHDSIQSHSLLLGDPCDTNVTDIQEKDKNRSQIDKTEHENEKTVRSQKDKVKVNISQKVNVNPGMRHWKEH
ncbi:hypothetical protein Tco_0504595 [Tanacetum coccineum]